MVLASFSTTPSTALEPGDRFEVVAEDGRVSLPEALPTFGIPLEGVVGPSGQVLSVRREGDAPHLVLPADRPLTANPTDTLWLEYQEGGGFRLVVEAPSVPLVQEKEDNGLSLPLAPEDVALLHDAVRQRASRAEFDLAREAAHLASHAGFDQLLCLPLVRDMELLEHQVRTAKTVLRRFRGKALLCDEVGLGKTIEAGLVFSELRTRGLVRSALVLVPPSLIEQWQGEMRRKFSLDLISHDDPVFRERGTAAWREFDLVIASLHTAKREPHRSAILGRQWDLVIVDEAHHLRNRTTQAWRFASELQKQYTLLLTATPVQNNLEELFNLVSLLEPGLLRTARQFQKQFVDRRDKMTPRNVDELHRLLTEVMVRNRRSTVGLQFTRRWAQTIGVAPKPAERGLYSDVADFVRRHLAAARASSDKPGRKTGRAALSRMALLALQTALGSSSAAAAGTLARLAETEGLAAAEREALERLAEQAAGQTDSSKVDRLLALLNDYPDKMVLFTHFRATQDMLAERLRQAGHEVAVFHGGLSRLAKEEAIARFRGPARLLLATEAGSEGRNLQFAHAVCNFDLPWNPMRIEQRIGRLSRIGQTRDIHVFNLVAAGTVEEAVLHLLEAKLNLFELVIGEVDMILGNLDEEREFEDVVADLWAESSDLADFRARLERLGDRLLEAKQAYFAQREHDDRLFGDRFTPDR
jgi:SNF2 family DNA or RNA helicase